MEECMDGDLFLSEEDVLRIEASQLRMQLAAAMLRERRLQEKLDEVTTFHAQAQLQIRSHELTIAHVKHTKDVELAIKQLDVAYATAGKSHEDLKVELGKCYGIDDWNNVTYDVLTGKITLM